VSDSNKFEIGKLYRAKAWHILGGQRWADSPYIGFRFWEVGHVYNSFLVEKGDEREPMIVMFVRETLETDAYPGMCIVLYEEKLWLTKREFLAEI